MLKMVKIGGKYVAAEGVRSIEPHYAGGWLEMAAAAKPGAQIVYTSGAAVCVNATPDEVAAALGVQAG